MYIAVNDSKSLDKFNKNFNKGQWIVLYYANWCGYCQMLKPEWNSFVKEHAMSQNNYNVAEIEDSYMYDLKENPNIMGFPTIRAYRDNKLVSEMEGPKDKVTINQFSNSNVNRILKKLKKNKSVSKKKLSSKKKSLKKRK
jgi:thiol-disulfide isomerase/thioredoxin